MNILYIGVHSHTGWGAEFWLKKAFERRGDSLTLYDFRANRKKFKSWGKISRELQALEKTFHPNLVFIQRANNVPPKAFRHLAAPLFFWSTEPIQLKNDVDLLLQSDLFSWVWVHSYSCLERIHREFPHLRDWCSIMHNGCPGELIDFSPDRERFALFNRNLSPRRDEWLAPSAGIVDIAGGKFGEDYFSDLARSHIAVNVHYSEKNLDDFESGILEAMAKGCVVVSETLNAQTVRDLKMQGAIIEVDSPQNLRNRLTKLKRNLSLLEPYRKKSREAIRQNTWDDRAKMFAAKFKEIIDRMPLQGKAQ